MKITYIGHSTCLIETGGKKILTDPIWAKRLFFFRRLQAPGKRLEDLLPVDLILLSHAHFDHLDSPALKKINKDAIIICTKNLRRMLLRRGFTKVYELDWWQSIELLGMKITSVPAKHFGGRWQLWDRFLGYCGFVVERAKKRFYFAGDTAYFELFKELAQVFTIDLAFLPIGAYQAPGKADFRKVHMDPQQAVSAFQDLAARFMMPIHYGTYRLSIEPPEEPEAWLREVVAARHLNGKVKILKPGNFLEL